MEKEIIEHVLFWCTTHDECRAELKDIVDDIWMSVSDRNFVHSKAHVDCSGVQILSLNQFWISIFSHH